MKDEKRLTCPAAVLASRADAASAGDDPRSPHTVNAQRRHPEQTCLFRRHLDYAAICYRKLRAVGGASTSRSSAAESPALASAAAIRRHQASSVCLLERHPRPGMGHQHATTAACDSRRHLLSGRLAQGRGCASKAATSCTRFCARHGVPHVRSGKLNRRSRTRAKIARARDGCSRAGPRNGRRRLLRIVERDFHGPRASRRFSGHRRAVVARQRPSSTPRSWWEGACSGTGVRGGRHVPARQTRPDRRRPAAAGRHGAAPTERESIHAPAVVVKRRRAVRRRHSRRCSAAGTVSGSIRAAASTPSWCRRNDRSVKWAGLSAAARQRPMASAVPPGADQPAARSWLGPTIQVSGPQGTDYEGDRLPVEAFVEARRRAACCAAWTVDDLAALGQRDSRPSCIRPEESFADFLDPPAIAFQSCRGAGGPGIDSPGLTSCLRGRPGWFRRPR